MLLNTQVFYLNCTLNALDPFQGENIGHLSQNCYFQRIFLIKWLFYMIDIVEGFAQVYNEIRDHNGCVGKKK